MTAVLLSLASPIRCFAHDFFVDASSGDDTASGRTWSDAFAGLPRALSAALDDAMAGNLPVVRVAAGTYAAEGLAITAPLHLIGGYPPGGGSRDHERNEVLLDGRGTAESIVVSLGLGPVVVDGFVLRGATARAIWAVRGEPVLRNLTVEDVPGTGIDVYSGTVERCKVRNCGDGIYGALMPWSARVHLRDNVVEGSHRFGIHVSDGGRGPDSDVRVTGNRILSTGDGSPGAIGLSVSGYVTVFNDEVATTNGVGANVGGDVGVSSTPLANLTIRGSTGPAVTVARASDLTLIRCILWDNAGGDVDAIPATTDIQFTLSEAALPGLSNITGSDPLFVDGPYGTSYLSSRVAGQGVDSPAIDAGGVSAANALLAFRTTRTDGVRDDGVADIGYHAPPSSYTLERGTLPDALSPLATAAMLPVLDVGAAGPTASPLYYYMLDSDDSILLERRDMDVRVRFNWQEYDE